MKSWLFLLIAIVSEVIGTSALKQSESFTRLIPTIICAVSFASAFYFLSLTLRTIHRWCCLCGVVGPRCCAHRFDWLEGVWAGPRLACRYWYSAYFIRRASYESFFSGWPLAKGASSDVGMWFLACSGFSLLCSGVACMLVGS